MAPIGTSQNLVLSDDKCPICLAGKNESKVYNKVQVSVIVKNNIEIFSSFLGIPINLMQRIISCQSTANSVRNEEKKFNCMFLQPFQPLNDNFEVKELRHDGGLINNPKEIIDHIISKMSPTQCPLCLDDMTPRAKQRIWNNEKCRIIVCNKCLESNYKKNIAHGSKIPKHIFCCAACTTPISMELATSLDLSMCFVAMLSPTSVLPAPGTPVTKQIDF